jgi:hypothetical protein
LTELGGPTTQAGINYQNRIAALYLGRMLDPRSRSSRERPVEVQVETQHAVDDFSVLFADGTWRHYQVKLALRPSGSAWAALWKAFHTQISSHARSQASIALVLGEPSSLAANLRECARRTDSTDTDTWSERLTKAHRGLVSSIKEQAGLSLTEAWEVFSRLELSVMPAADLTRDFAPLWMPPANVDAAQLFSALTEIAAAGAESRRKFRAAEVRETLASERGLHVAIPPRWGIERYQKAVIETSTIEVPGTSFVHTANKTFLWPRALRFDRDRMLSFDDDLPGWRGFSKIQEVDLRSFPSAELGAVVLIAGPGFGKSTVINAIARRVSSEGRVPAVIPITKLSDSDSTIEQYLEHSINADFDVSIDWSAAAASGALVLLLDGLDEVSSDRRTVVLERLRVYVASRPSVQWIMTVRDAAVLAVPEGAQALELAPLGPEDIPRYVEFYRPGEQQIADALVARIASHPELAQLTRIPIFLALMLVLRLENADLRRSDLLEIYLETLLNPSAYKSAQSEAIEAAGLRKVASRVAFDALESDSMGVTRQSFERVLRLSDIPVSADEAREALHRRGLLRKQNLSRSTFPFPIVHEYLASEVLAERETEELIKRASLISKRPWAQAIQFTLERHPDPRVVIASVLSEKDDAFHSGLRLLGRCLANGMSAAAEQRYEIGSRLSRIWGSWHSRADELISSIVVDAFSDPLHPEIEARLAERSLLHQGAGAILVHRRDTSLTLRVLGDLLRGDIEHLLNLGDFQNEVDRVGTAAFNLYVERVRSSDIPEKDADALSCLIGHMSVHNLDASTAYAAAKDASLPPQFRLACWSKSGRALDEEFERLIIEAANTEGFHHGNSAAQALSAPQIDHKAVLRILHSDAIPPSKAEDLIGHMVSDWREAGLAERARALLSECDADNRITDHLRIFAVDEENLAHFDQLVERVDVLSPEVVSTVVMLLGHALNRDRVKRVVDAVSRRSWDAAERESLVGSFSCGLTSRIELFALRSGSLQPIPSHPGRSVPYELIANWLNEDDYTPTQRLRMLVDAISIGMAIDTADLRASFDAAMSSGTSKDTNNSALAGRALEALHSLGENFDAPALEAFAIDEAYNLATSAVALIAASGTPDAVSSLINVHEKTSSWMLQSVVLGHLEPLASRLGLRVLRRENGSLEVSRLRT